jgi:hypothetical protein
MLGNDSPPAHLHTREAHVSPSQVVRLCNAVIDAVVAVPLFRPHTPLRERLRGLESRDAPAAAAAPNAEPTVRSPAFVPSLCGPL